MSHPPSEKKPTIWLLARGVIAVSIGLAFTFTGYGQVSTEEHAKHHPSPGVGTPGTAPPAGPIAEAGKGSGMEEGTRNQGVGPPGNIPPAGPMAGKGMGGGMDMGKMMENMGKAPPKELYPTLMSLPDLSPEQREEVRGKAQERMRSGVTLLSEGLEKLAQAAENEDYAAMQEATAQVREALAQFESGLAAQRALAEGKPPRQVALQWFKGEMNLQPPQGVEVRGGLFGVSLFHLFTMVILIAFALAMVAMYFFKMRRAAALFGRIETDSGRPPPGSARPLAAPPVAGIEAASPEVP